MSRNHYATLEIHSGAGRREILKARNRLLRRYHPDLNPDDRHAAKEKTIEILHAAEVLLDPASRAEYDRTHTGRAASAQDPGGQHRRHAGAASQPGPGFRRKPRFVYDCPSCKRSAVNPYGEYCLYCGHGRTSVACPECGHDNFNPTRNFCMYCGAGIGDNPRPFSVEEQTFEKFRRAAMWGGGRTRAPLFKELLFVASAAAVIFGGVFAATYYNQTNSMNPDYLTAKLVLKGIAVIVVVSLLYAQRRHSRWY